MPAVVAFGRRWLCGTDDFVFPGILDTIVKSCWLITALLAYFQMQVEDYENRKKFEVYLVGMMASLVIIVMTDLLVVNRSSKGSITETHLRAIIPTLVYIRLFWEAVDTGWNTLGTIWAFGPTFATVQIHDPSSYYFTRRYIICNWISLIVLALFFAFLYDPLGGLKLEKQEFSEAQTQFWAKKLKMYCSILYKPRSRVEDEQQIFQAIGSTVSSVLGETNFVSSDLVAGLFLVFRLEEDQGSHGSSLCAGPETKLESFSLQEMHHRKNAKSAELSCSMDSWTSETFKQVLQFEKYFPFTDRSHNWARQMDAQHQHNFSRIVNSCSCFATASDCDSQFDANGFCQTCKMSSLMAAVTATGISESDLIHVSTKTSYTEVPFCIFVDHNSSSLVLVVLPGQSLLSFMDAAALYIPGSATNFQVHGGLNKVSEKVSVNVVPVLEEIKKRHSNYNLVIIGSSFGSGVAALLGFRLRSKFPELRVICFNPPGGLLNCDAARYSENFIISVTCGNDLFARANMLAISRLRHRIIDAMYNAKTPKYKLLLGVLLRFLGFKLKVTVSSKEIDFNGHINQGHITDSSVELGESDLHSKWTEKNYQATRSTRKGDEINMYLPGRIIYIDKTNAEKNNDAGLENSYEVKILDARCNKFLDIIPKPGILDDHYKSRDWILHSLKKHSSSHEASQD